METPSHADNDKIATKTNETRETYIFQFEKSQLSHMSSAMSPQQQQNSQIRKLYYIIFPILCYTNNAITMLLLLLNKLSFIHSFKPFHSFITGHN